MRTDIDIVMGSFGFGDLIEYASTHGTPINTGYQQLRDLINVFTAAGKYVIFESTIGTYNQTTPDKFQFAQGVLEALFYFAQTNPYIYIVPIDPTQGWTAPSTGQVDGPVYMRKMSATAYDAFHPNRYSERQRAQLVYSVLSRNIPTPYSDLMAQSIFDRHDAQVVYGGAGTGPNNYFLGNWDAPAANYLPTINASQVQLATGLPNPGMIQEIDQTEFYSSGPSPAVAKVRTILNNGHYDQIITFSGSALPNDSFVFWISGRDYTYGGVPVQGELVDLLKPDRQYQLYLDFAWSTSSTAGYIQDYNILVVAEGDYTGINPPLSKYTGILAAVTANHVWDTSSGALGENSFTNFPDYGAMTLNPPYSGMHYTEAFKIPSAIVRAFAASRISIQLSVVLSGGPGQAILQFGRIAIRDVTPP